MNNIFSIDINKLMLINKGYQCFFVFFDFLSLVNSYDFYCNNSTRSLS